jgi:hypothetical protein
MTATALDNLIKAQHAQCKALNSKLERNLETLYLALEEMERRFEKQQRYRTDLKPLKAPTWHGYLQSRGVQPAAYRQWKSRRNKVTAPVVTPETSVVASELVRMLSSDVLKSKLTTIVKDQARLNPVVRTGLITALRNAAKDMTAYADDLSAFVTPISAGKCYQRVVREQMALLPEPDLAEKREAAASLNNASVREITYKEAENLIISNEYLGTMNASTKYSVGLIFKHPKTGREFIGGVACFGTVGGTNVAAGICGSKYKDRVLVLVRGTCCHWADHPVESKGKIHTGAAASWLISRACDLMAGKGYNIICAFADPAALEIGTIYSALNWTYGGMTQASEKYRTPDGKEHDSRQIHGLTRDRKNGGLTYKRTRKEQRRILEKQGCTFHKGNAKHKYVHFSGDKRTVKELQKALLWDTSKPYPKRQQSEIAVLEPMKQITFSYPGGKARLATKLCDQFPRSGKRFVDVFAGRGNLLWRAMQLLNYDSWWINDIRTAPFLETILTHGHTIVVPPRSREEYTRQKADYISRTPESILLEPYLTYSGGGFIWSGFRAGKWVEGGGRAGFDMRSAGISQSGYQAMLLRAHQMLMCKDVEITKLDYKGVLSQLGDDDFAYIDPPYADCDVRAYEGNDINHAELIEILKSAKFQWALSEYKNPIYIDAFGEPTWQQDRTITMGRGTDRPKRVRTECLWFWDKVELQLAA